MLLRIAIVLSFLIILFVSCSDSNSTPEDSKAETTNMVTIDLTNKELPFRFYISKLDSNSQFISILHDEGNVEWILKMNEIEVLIEDWGKEAKSLELEKKRLETVDQIFDHKYLEEKQDYFIYSKSLPFDTLNLQHHIFSVKNINGVFFTLRSKPMEVYSLEQIKKIESLFATFEEAEIKQNQPNV